MWMRLLAAGIVLAASAACTDDDSTASTASVATTPPPTAAVTSVSDPAVATTSPATPVQATSVPATPAPATAPATACPALTPGVNEITLTGGGADHPVRIFVPASFAGQPLPVVLNWHGLGSDGPQQAAYTGYEGLAESAGFIAVHPTGIANSWELTDDQDPNRDDLAFANVLIDTLIADWCVDARRVYSTGMSNGGYFTARLLCEAADRIAAAASVAGTFHPDTCSPSRPVPYLAYHGTADTIVPFDGSGESVLNTGNDPALQAFFEQVMPDEFAEFAADGGCAPEPASTPVGTEVIRYDYAGCTDGTPYTFFEITGGGHTWPSSPLAALTAGLGPTTDDVDATADSWAFFGQHVLPG